MEKLYNNKYKKVSKIGGGSFGSVWLVKNGDKTYAMKKYYLDNIQRGGAVRQYELLSQFKHQNIHEVIEMFIAKNKNQYLISEYYPNNLYDFVSKNLPESAIKGIIYQLATGVNYLHQMNYLHRDIKPDNILISSEGVIKLTDFDLCRLTSKGKEDCMTRTAVTLYYRAPEIFFGDSYYGKPIDIWSIGCVFAELVIGRPIFKGSNELSTLSKIITTIGSPSEENWPGVSQLPNYFPLGGGQFTLDAMLRESKLSDDGINLVTKMLSLDPKKRPTCEDIINDEYFKKDTSTPQELKEIMKLK